MTDISYASISRKKKLVRGLILATIVAAGAAITLSKQDTSSEQVVPSKDNTLSISGPWEISSLDPSKQGYILTRMQVIETLLNVDETGTITPGLAKKWHSSEDGLTWHLTLRDNVTFHDGSKMNAESVVRSLANAQRKHGTLNKADVRRISAVNSNEITIELVKPYAAFASLLTNYSNAILSPASFKSNGALDALYGTGPYQMASFAPPHKLTVQKFEHYWGEKAKIHFATYLTGHRAESRILQAKSGEADIVFTLEPSMLAQLQSHDEVTVHSNLIPRTMFIKVNAGHPFLNDIKARRALSMALDRSSIAKNVLGSPGAETAQLMPSSMSQWFIEGVTADKFNVEQARSMLADLGWKPRTNGVLERDGVPFKLTMITYADRPELTIVATAIQAQWAKIGVDLNVDVTNSSMIPAGHQDGSLELALIARNFGFSADPLPIISSDFANGGGDWGTMNWENETVNKAIAKLLDNSDATRALELSQQVAGAIYREMPVIPVSSYSQHTSVNKRVKHFKFDPFERNYFINQMEIN
ncbi:ABC transporter substrate-binding protein [Vibrio mytili]|uniref:ABC transporter substrate-binding protein n=1 Tax=Vibrio mytili TaxID=50718 RepID=A0A0C3DK90_9VIBR|nr:ABC transporter substrate-binding protein [Vibrio mytili]KIN11874.1 ABC transporter substrate-binding protein [Vibrio mytili]